jgi:S1-C subfamily serine protease
VVDVLLPPIPISKSREVQPGDWVITLGTSFRMQATQSMGNVAYILAEPRFKRLQLTNAAYPGNSGGAALNADGELIGLVHGELGQGSYAERSDRPRPGGMTFVLAIENVRRVYESLRREGRVAYGHLGVSTSGASIEAMSEPGARVPLGALVEAIEPGGPAARAGLRINDLIVAFDRERVEYPEQLARWVAATPPGTEVELVWVRGDERRSARFPIAASPHQTPSWASGEEPPPSNAPATSTGTTAERITDLERQVLQLNREINRLKRDDSSGTGGR